MLDRCWIDSGSIQDRSRIGSMLDRSRIDPGLIQDQSWIDSGLIWDRFCGDRLDLRYVSGETTTSASEKCLRPRAPPPFPPPHPGKKIKQGGAPNHYYLFAFFVQGWLVMVGDVLDGWSGMKQSVWQGHRRFRHAESRRMTGSACQAMDVIGGLR